MGEGKYALLDTDFISKAHLIRKDDSNKLIDKIINLPNYLAASRVLVITMIILCSTAASISA